MNHILPPMVLIVLDGWGLAPPGPGNAISLARIKHIPRYWVSYPHTELAASGELVGLPPGEDGNTETGHMNIGAGRIVYQDLPRINMAISEGNFFTNEAFIGAVRFAVQKSSNLHIMGIVSDAGVHGSREHLFALLKLVKQQQFPRSVYLHLFTDGRDSQPQSGLRFISEVEDRCRTLGVGKIATIMGRYYAMDRDRRWERTETAYKALTQITDRIAPSAGAVMEQTYLDGKTDEFIEPTIILDETGKPYPRIQSNDAVIFYNFRVDRPRQLTRAFILPNFEAQAADIAFDPYTVKYHHKHVVEEDPRRKPFTRNVVLSNVFFVTMTEYERGLPATVAFPPQSVKMPLGQVIADNNLRQLRMAETEKERFVMYYFNGLVEDPFSGEDRVIIPSPQVPTYDLKPEMSAFELTNRLLERLSLGLYSFALVNFANTDMVAHTGSISPAIRACEVVDECVAKIVDKTLAMNGTCIITADHGNVEEMLGPTGNVDTEHSTFPVPFIVVQHAFDHFPLLLPKGKLGDIAPTILELMKLPVPSDMTGNSLISDMLMQRRLI